MKTYQLMAFLLQYARMLSGKAGVAIKIAGNTAKTDGKTVWVPLLLDVKDALLVKVLYVGYIVHEVCHVLWTDFEVFRSASAKKRPFLNIFEDVSIEKKMGEWLPGCRQSLMELVKKLFEMGRFGNPAEVSSMNSSLQAYCLYGLRSKVLGQMVLAGYADVAAKDLISQLPQGSLGKIDSVIDGVASSQSTAERLAIVDELFNLLEEIEEQMKQEPQQSSNDDQSNSSSDSEGEGNQSDADKPSESDDGDQGQSGEDESEKDDSESGQGSDDQSDKDGEKADGDASSSSDADNEDDSKGSESGKQPGGKGSLTEADDSFKADVGDLANDAMDGEILEAAEENSHANGEPMLDLGNVKRKQANQSPEAVHRVKAVTNGLAFKMRSLVESQTYCRKSLRDQGPTIDRKSIHRVVTGDLKVFKHEKKSTGINTAVYLMIDTSGSMCYTMDIARDALLSIALALEQVPDVQVAVGRYPCISKDDENNYSIGIEEVVAFGERVATRSGAIESMHALGGTPTAEALIHVASELSQTKADRKICFLLTDGEPDDSKFLRRVLRDVENEIEVIAIGIKTTAVKYYFDRYAVVNRIEDLPGECFKQLQQTLLKAA